MRLYTMEDLNEDGTPARTDKDLRFRQVHQMTDWSEDQIDRICDMQPGDKINFDGITVERTK